MSSRNRKDDSNLIHRAAENIGEMKDSNPKKPSVMSSGGAIGRQFNRTSPFLPFRLSHL